MLTQGYEPQLGPLSLWPLTLVRWIHTALASALTLLLAAPATLTASEQPGPLTRTGPLLQRAGAWVHADVASQQHLASHLARPAACACRLGSA